MPPIIKAYNLSKHFYINHTWEPDTLKEFLTGFIRNPLSKFKKSPKEEFWSLKDVSFEVMQGEVFGVVGPNGSGKSTLLKLLSRIMDPTSGRAEIYGRISSLLEVGTGFHPDLTGRENIYLCGAILGMTKKEITAKFDTIIEFSGIEKFIDTPVKHYSNGMYIRLAFSVGVHLDSDILILDEILAVGDDSFQKKFTKQIEHIIKQGKTILIVSHSDEIIMRFCDKAMLLINGQVKTIGPTAQTLALYHEMCK